MNATHGADGAVDDVPLKLVDGASNLLGPQVQFLDHCIRVRNLLGQSLVLSVGV